MKYEDKEFIALFTSFWLFMIAIVCQMIWGWPTDRHLFWVSIVWLVVGCVSGLYSWYLDSKDEI